MHIEDRVVAEVKGLPYTASEDEVRLYIFKASMLIVGDHGGMT